MIRTFSAALAALAAANLLAFSARAEGPELVEKTLHTSDVQYRFTRSPDNKALSVLFDNLGVALLPGGDAAPVVTRVFPLTIPVKDAGKGAMLSAQTRGAVRCPEGAKCLLVLWVNGKSLAFDLSRKDNEVSASSVSAIIGVGGAEVYQAMVVLIAEREVKRTDVSATMTVDSLDLTISSPPGG